MKPLMDDGVGKMDRSVVLWLPVMVIGLKAPALRNINLSIPAGKTVALVGRSGSDKTTIASLITRSFGWSASAHRLSTIEKADEIIVVEDGVIVERGSHKVLFAHDGAYAKLHKMQFGASKRSFILRPACNSGLIAPDRIHA